MSTNSVLVLGVYEVRALSMTGERIGKDFRVFLFVDETISLL